MKLAEEIACFAGSRLAQINLEKATEGRSITRILGAGILLAVVANCCQHGIRDGIKRLIPPLWVH